MDVVYYAKFTLDTTTEIKTPKYFMTASVGNYPPMNDIRGREGKVYLYLMPRLKEGQQVPSMRLQAKGSLNFTGLKDYFENGKLTGVAYGEPNRELTYSKGNKRNPFYPYRGDGYLFVTTPTEVKRVEFAKNGTTIVPVSFELLVINGGRTLAPSYCRQLHMGGYNDLLQRLRARANGVL